MENQKLELKLKPSTAESKGRGSSCLPDWPTAGSERDGRVT